MWWPIQRYWCRFFHHKSSASFPHQVFWTQSLPEQQGRKHFPERGSARWQRNRGNFPLRICYSRRQPQWGWGEGGLHRCLVGILRSNEAWVKQKVKVRDKISHTHKYIKFCSIYTCTILSSIQHPTESLYELYNKFLHTLKTGMLRWWVAEMHKLIVLQHKHKDQYLCLQV